MYFCWFKHISPAFANIMLGVVFIMKKFEINPYIQYGQIGEIEVSIELSDEELRLISKMNKEDFTKFIKEKSEVKITDFDVDFDCPFLDEWDEVG